MMWILINTTRPTGVKGAGEPGCGARGRWRGLAAVPVGGGRARAGLEIDHSEPQARVWRSRGRAAAHRHTQRPGPSRQATRRPKHPWGHTATSNIATPHAHTKTPTRNRVGVSEPPVGIEPTTYSLRVNRSAD